MEEHPPADPVSYLVRAGGTPGLIDGLMEGLGDAEVAVVVGVDAVSGEVRSQRVAHVEAGVQGRCPRIKRCIDPSTSYHAASIVSPAVPG